MKTFKKITLGGLLLPVLTLAQPTPPTSGITSIQALFDRTTTLVNWIIGLFFIAAIASLVYSAFLFVTVAGDEKKLEAAKNQLLYSIIAITIAILAGSVRLILQNFLG